jgi:predicted RNA-binding protein YlqC (UPF0109 family)
MKEFLKFVVTNLVDRPEEILFRDEERASAHHYVLELPQSEVGKVIGKQGNTIRAIRNLMSAAASRQGRRATLEIIERPEAPD